MLKKSSRLIKFSVFLLALAPIMAHNIGSWVMIGEASLPEAIKKNS